MPNIETKFKIHIAPDRSPRGELKNKNLLGGVAHPSMTKGDMQSPSVASYNPSPVCCRCFDSREGNTLLRKNPYRENRGPILGRCPENVLGNVINVGDFPLVENKVRQSGFLTESAKTRKTLPHLWK